MIHVVVVDDSGFMRIALRKIIEAYPDAVLIGLTATPCRGDGRGLGGIFSCLIEAPQIPDLIELGFLVKTRVYAPIRPNLRGVRIRRGDYVEGELAERMDNPKLVGDIVTHWHKYGHPRKTVAFACNVAHSLHIRDEFVRSGVRAEHLDGATPDDERDAILARLETGETELVANCMVLTEGWDMPEVGCAILARPTRQMGLFRQMIGRVAGRKLNGPVVEAELSPTADDVCHLLGLVLHGSELGPRREDGVAERGTVAFGLLVGHEHSAPAPVRELDRVDLLE